MIEDPTIFSSRRHDPIQWKLNLDLFNGILGCHGRLEIQVPGRMRSKDIHDFFQTPGRNVTHSQGERPCIYRSCKNSPKKSILRADHSSCGPVGICHLKSMNVQNPDVFLSGLIRISRQFLAEFGMGVMLGAS